MNMIGGVRHIILIDRENIIRNIPTSIIKYYNLLNINGKNKLYFIIINRLMSSTRFIFVNNYE